MLYSKFISLNVNLILLAYLNPLPQLPLLSHQLYWAVHLSLNERLSNLGVNQTHPEGKLNADCLDSPSEYLIQEV